MTPRSLISAAAAALIQAIDRYPPVKNKAAPASRMIPKKLALAKAGVADFSDKIMRKIKENREHCRFNLIEKRSKTRGRRAGPFSRATIAEGRRLANRTASSKEQGS